MTVRESVVQTWNEFKELLKRCKRKQSKTNKTGTYSSYPAMCVRKTVTEDIPTLRHQVPPGIWAHSSKEYEACFYRGQRDFLKNKGLWALDECYTSNRILRNNLPCFSSLKAWWHDTALGCTLQSTSSPDSITMKVGRRQTTCQLSANIPWKLKWKSNANTVKTNQHLPRKWWRNTGRQKKRKNSALSLQFEAGGTWYNNS